MRLFLTPALSTDAFSITRILRGPTRLSPALCLGPGHHPFSKCFLKGLPSPKSQGMLSLFLTSTPGPSSPDRTRFLINLGQ